MPELTISVVSHAQSRMVADLLGDIARIPKIHSLLEVILTLNVDEELAFDPDGYGYTLKIIRNQIHRGFSANHNRAFAHAAG